MITNLDQYCHYSKNLTIISEYEKRFRRLTTEKDIKLNAGVSLITEYLIVISVYKENPKTIIESVVVQLGYGKYEDYVNSMFLQLKNKYILDYDNEIQTPFSSTKGGDSGSYDFAKEKRRLHSRRS